VSDSVQDCNCLPSTLGCPSCNPNYLADLVESILEDFERQTKKKVDVSILLTDSSWDLL
jgi:hypothetical protein